MEDTTLNPQIHDLAGLYEHPGYNALLDIYRQNVRALEIKMEIIEDPDILLKITRKWQALRSFLTMLEECPPQAAQQVRNQALAILDAFGDANNRQMSLGMMQ